MALASARRSQEAAVANARAASTELSRRRVERAEVAAYVERTAVERTPAEPAASTGRHHRRA